MKYNNDEIRERETFFSCLIDLDLRINFSDEQVGRVESDGSGEDPEGDHDDCGVAEVEQGWDEGGDFELRIKIKHAIQKHVKRASSTDKKASPPPVIIFGAQLKVDHNNRDLTAGNDQNSEY